MNSFLFYLRSNDRNILFWKLKSLKNCCIFSSVIVLGDVNTSHKRIDHCDPDDSEVLAL